MQRLEVFMRCLNGRELAEVPVIGKMTWVTFPKEVMFLWPEPVMTEEQPMWKRNDPSSVVEESSLVVGLWAWDGYSFNVVRTLRFHLVLNCEN